MKLLITGAGGFVGQNLVKYINENNTDIELFTPNRSELDLRLYPEIVQYLSIKEITHIIHLAARVGGIGANKRFPAQFFYDNLYLSVNVMHAASHCISMKKFINVATICGYPKFTPVPFREEDFWNGYPEETNAPYGIANKAAIVYGQALNQEYNFKVVNLLPVNMAGSGDNFNPIYSHVIPAIILKIDKAKDLGYGHVDLWGTGQATREFLHVEDCARAIMMALEFHEDSEPINVGIGREISICNLAYKLKDLMKYEGELVFTGQVSDGQPRRCLDVSRAKEKFGFVAEKTLDNILRDELEYYYDLKSKNYELVNGWREMI